jgi:hypothetical protein
MTTFKKEHPGTRGENQNASYRILEESILEKEPQNGSTGHRRPRSPPQTPQRNARRLGPYAHDGSRELALRSPAPIGAIPGADHSVVPLRGRIYMVRFAERLGNMPGGIDRRDTLKTTTQ